MLCTWTFNLSVDTFSTETSERNSVKIWPDMLCNSMLTFHQKHIALDHSMIPKYDINSKHILHYSQLNFWQKHLHVISWENSTLHSSVSAHTELVSEVGD